MVSKPFDPSGEGVEASVWRSVDGRRRLPPEVLCVSQPHAVGSLHEQAAGPEHVGPPCAGDHAVLGPDDRLPETVKLWIDERLAGRLHVFDEIDIGRQRSSQQM